MGSTFGKWVIILGLTIALVGVIIYFFGDRLHWIGRLPGDIRVERENFTFYFPITTMLLASAFITILLRLAQRLF